MPDIDGLMGNLEVQDKRVSIKDILSIMFSRSEKGEKTVLQNKQENAIIKILFLDDYLKEIVGVDLGYKKLVEYKRSNVLSIKGRGREDIINVVKAMQPQNIDIEKNKNGGLF